jgi:hypothetical protein
MASIVLEDGQVTLNAVIFSKTLETEGTSEQLQSDWALSLILFQYGGEFFKQFYVLIVE